MANSVHFSLFLSASTVKSPGMGAKSFTPYAQLVFQNQLLKSRGEATKQVTQLFRAGYGVASIFDRSHAGVNRWHFASVLRHKIPIFRRPKLHISALAVLLKFAFVCLQSDCGSSRQRVSGQGVEQSARRLQTMAPGTLQRQSKRWLRAASQKNTSSAFIRQQCRWVQFSDYILIKWFGRLGVNKTFKFFKTLKIKATCD